MGGDSACACTGTGEGGGGRIVEGAGESAGEGSGKFCNTVAGVGGGSSGRGGEDGGGGASSKTGPLSTSCTECGRTDLLESGSGMGESVLGISGKGTSSLVHCLGVVSSGMVGGCGCSPSTGVLVREPPGSSGFAMVSLPDVMISCTELESEDLRLGARVDSCGNGSIDGAGTRRMGSGDLDIRDDARWPPSGGRGLTGVGRRLLSALGMCGHSLPMAAALLSGFRITLNLLTRRPRTLPLFAFCTDG